MSYRARGFSTDVVAALRNLYSEIQTSIRLYRT